MDSDRVNLAICAPGELYGGVERFVSTFAEYLRDETRIMPTVVLFQEDEHSNSLKRNGIDTVVIQSKWKYDPRVLKKLVHLFKSRQINVVHTNGYKATILGAIAARICGARTVKTEHGRMEPRKHFDYAWFRMRCNLFADKVVTRFLVDRVAYVTHDLQYSFQKGGHDGKSSVIYNGIPPVSFDSPSSLPDMDRSAFNIGIVGRLSEVKGHRTLLAAFASLRDLRDIRLTIIGRGPLRSQLEEFCRKNALADVVQFLDFRENIHDYIGAFDVLAMPSVYEGLPYVLLESMYLKTPVIGSNVGGLKEVLRNETDALLVEPGDAKGLERAIRHLYSHEAERIRLAENAYQKVRQSFMISRMAQQYMEIFCDDLQIRSGGIGVSRPMSQSNASPFFQEPQEDDNGSLHQISERKRVHRRFS